MSRINNLNSMPFNNDELARITFNAILNNNSEGIYFKDLESKFILLSIKQASHLGIDNPTEALGKTDFDFFSHIHAQQAYNDEQRIIATGNPILNRIEVETWSSGENNYVVTSKYPLLNDESKIIGTWGHSLSLESLQNSKEGSSLKELLDEHIQDERLSTKIDQLTKLKNVKSFLKALNLTYQSAMNHQAMKDKDFALLMIDIEGFNTINQDYGHHGGDSALIFMAELLEEIIGSKEQIFMYGTNAFAVIIEIGTTVDALALSEKIIKTAKTESFQHEEWNLNLLLNIGLCTFREVLPRGTIYDIINLADARLADAKKKGPNAIVYERE